MTDDEYVIRSVTIAEILEANGDRAITYQTEGDPSDWDVLGLLDWVAAVIRNAAVIPEDED